MDRPAGLGQASAGSPGAQREDLAQHRDRRLGRRARADVQAAGRVDPGQLVVADARLAQPLLRGRRGSGGSRGAPM
jgi:hypothetical protein